MTRAKTTKTTNPFAKSVPAKAPAKPEAVTEAPEADEVASDEPGVDFVDADSLCKSCRKPADHIHAKGV